MIKNALIASALTLSAMPALASGYRCDFGPVAGAGSLSLLSSNVSFTFDPATQPNATADAGDGINVGCLAFRSHPELLSCWIATSSDILGQATSDSGVRLLGTTTTIKGAMFSLNCVRS